MISLSPWLYRNLLYENDVINHPNFYEVDLLDGSTQFESLICLKKHLLPKWISSSEIYNNSDGAGTSQFKNIAVYKAISEALERWAFYVTVDTNEKKFCFNVNPTTTGMAAYPGLTARGARSNSIMEANERWALHEFWRGNLPINELATTIENLRHFEIISPFQNCHISLLSFSVNNQYLYAFASETSQQKSFQHALVELARNIRVMAKIKDTAKVVSDFKDISDKRLFYFSTEDGHELFKERIKSAPLSITVKPNLICDQEIKGEWNKYTKVWRYLYDKSYPDSDTDHTFFMF